MAKPSPKKSPNLITAEQHGINEDLICPHAKTIVDTLVAKGYQAYLVGGCVRDLLLGIEPKDFDIATNAHPQHICRHFSNSRIIGRRFQIVHVYHRREFIEVSTFRARVNTSTNKKSTQYTDDRLVRDNTFGTIEEDAERRDFTVNALYYDLQNSTVLDFCNGMQDITARRLHMIGDPELRYREDPVRMLRALRFRAKLGFEIAEDTAQPIYELGHLLLEVSKPRLFDEVIKLFHSGHAQQCYHELDHFDLLPILFPQTTDHLQEDESFRDLIDLALANTDMRINQGKSVNPAFIFAVLLWKPYLEVRETYCRKGVPRFESMWEAGRATIMDQSAITMITKRFLVTICEIWKLQDRLPKAHGKKVFQILQIPKFRASYDFLCLRAKAGEIDSAEADWWTNIQAVSEQEQLALVSQRTKKFNQKKQRKKTKSDA
jgi:poly(A) polymerase